MSDELLRLTPKGMRQAREARYRREFSSLESLCRSVLREEPVGSNRANEMAVDIRWIEGCLEVIKGIHEEVVNAGE
tara:strand:- start:556 stop:783 length:228 start_codon:yes stop_codon:yes gene_type:complete